MSKRIQSLARFLLEQLHKEAGLTPPTATLAPADQPAAGTSITDQIFGATLRTSAKVRACGRTPVCGLARTAGRPLRRRCIWHSSHTPVLKVAAEFSPVGQASSLYGKGS